MTYDENHYKKDLVDILKKEYYENYYRKDSVDISKMPLEKLETLRDLARDRISKTSLDDKQNLAILRQVLLTLNHRILMRKLIKHKYSGLSD